MKRAEIVPAHFVSLQLAGFWCENYYTGTGGKKIGLTPEILSAVGLLDDTLWIHQDLPARLAHVADLIRDEGYGIIIKDAWRPVKLYDHIIKRRNDLGLPVSGLISAKSMPHATGMVVDAVLSEPDTPRAITMRNQARDGLESCYYNFYCGKYDEESQVFQAAQDLLIKAFVSAGFRLGRKREYWHFEMPNIGDATRF